jgi:hypothetical protein
VCERERERERERECLCVCASPSLVPRAIAFGMCDSLYLCASICRIFLVSFMYLGSCAVSFLYLGSCQRIA